MPQNIQIISSAQQAFEILEAPTKSLCYNTESKTRVLELENNSYIIEEDAYGDFFYGAKPTPLKASDESDRIIYIKSFDRVFTPGLLSFMVCPEEIFNRLRESEVSGYIQRGMDYYLRNYDFDAHCSEIRAYYAKKYRRAIAAAEAFLSPHAKFTKPEHGLYFWVTPNSPRDFSNEFLTRKVIVTPGKLFSAKMKNSFRISFASATDDEISKGIGIIASVLKGR
jgi:DNA-binding transcriptional MocR family regulator